MSTPTTFKKISDLAAATTPLAGTELIELEASGSSKKATVQNIIDAATSSGDMATATYDPAGIAQQLVGVTAAQTLTNKNLSDTTNTFPVKLQSQLVGINDQTGTTYTLALTDAGKDVRCNNASAVTLTVPPNASVAFPIGTLIVFAQKGAGAVTATAGSGVTVNAAYGAATTSQFDARVLEKTDTDTWRVW